ncbi:hypothetical protein GCM10017566_59540 [Amycolatopsis bartoniae]|uniref:Uncharacterized protein n=1 Tax=Amycolatopsis bartoniae TaxID=941986 RepID=A0A8H9IX09_9PSEU|nr:hypothetical protein GCM10017566_59540 [Amycolatopsis bartoniae]
MRQPYAFATRRIRPRSRRARRASSGVCSNCPGVAGRHDALSGSAVVRRRRGSYRPAGSRRERRAEDRGRTR